MLNTIKQHYYSYHRLVMVVTFRLFFVLSYTKTNVTIMNQYGTDYTHTNWKTQESVIKTLKVLFLCKNLWVMC